jgi:hypothetical protein
MYRTTITNFKFFNQNNNSIFIAEILNNFIPSTSKKNDFLIVEGEMLEEILFIKDGKIALNAAVEKENQLQSIIKYYTENFQPFLTEEEKKFINENTQNLNNNNNGTIKSSVINYRKKTLINARIKSIQSLKAVKKIKNKDDKTHQEINDLYQKIDIPKKSEKKEKYNEDDAYHYLKIVDIRKNEHFGVLFLTMNKPVPLSLQVKSKIVELFLLKKEHALKISKNYSNIWRNIYEKEYKNFMSIKHFTFSILNKYIKENKLLFNKRRTLRKANRLPGFDLNFFENFVSLEKHLTKIKRQSGQNYNENFPRNYTMNYQFNNTNQNFDINIIGTNSFLKKKNKIDNNKTCTSISQKYNTPKNKSISFSNFSSLNKRIVRFSNQNYNNEINNNKKNEKINISNSIDEMKNKVSNEMEQEENNILKKNTKKVKLKNLKNFLIECKKYFMNNKLSKNNTNQSIQKIEKNLSLPKSNIKKSCIKKRN